MKSWIILAAGLAITAARGQEEAPPGFDPERHMRISEVRPGMKGYGLSVFRGTRIERFDAEVISVLRRFNPADDVVLVRLKGANLEHTGPVAGMSGSPVFLRDQHGRERMIGAFAYGWPLLKEPMGGVQPIEYMLRIAAGPSQSRQPPPATRAATIKQPQWTLPLATTMLERPGRFRRLAEPRLAQNLIPTGPTRMQPLAVPLSISGLSARTCEQFEPILRSHGWMLLQAGAAAAADWAEQQSKLEPGAAIAVPLLSGDMELAAMGTCTEVLGDRVLAFGHAFSGEGEISLPLSMSFIHGVVPVLSTSFKLGAASRPVGTLVADHAFGVRGRMGSAPPMLPIQIRCLYEDGSLDRTYRFQAAIHSRLTPLLATMALASAITATRDLPEHHTLDLDLTLEFTGGQKILLRNCAADSNPGDLLSLLGLPISGAWENPFRRVPPAQLSGVVRVWPHSRLAEIQSVSLARTRYQPGQTVKLFVQYRPFQGSTDFLPVEFPLPSDLPDGQYEFSITDWQQYLLAEQTYRPFRFSAHSIEDVFGVLQEVSSVRRDALYLRLLRQADGVALGRTAMAQMPSSRRRVLLGAGLSNVVPFVSSVVRTVPTEHVMSGGVQLTITIDRETRVEGGSRAEQPGAPGAVAPQQAPPQVRPLVRPRTPRLPGLPGGTDGREQENP